MSETRRESFHVAELDCAEEVLLLERQLASRPGIAALECNILQSRMFVTYQPDVISTEAIVQLVTEVGLTALRWDDRLKATEVSWWERNERSVLCLLSGVLLLTGFVVHAVFAGSVVTAFSGEAESPPLLSFILYVLSILAGARHVVPKAWTAVRKRHADMNLLMSIAVVGALVIGEWFEAGMVTFLFALALLLEHWSMARTRRAIGGLMNLAPPVARCRTDAGELLEQPVEAVELGTTILVRPGERIPLDGVIVSGSSSVDEAPITGESMPAEKTIGDELYAGSVNQQGVLEFQATRHAGDTTLARIVQMIEDASTRRAPSEQWVETFARYYTPSMMLLALAIVLVAPLGFGASWSEWIYRGLVVLVIACPCALVISTPVSIVSALTTAARRGVLVKGGRFLELAANLKTVALDKTGTLTIGRPVVQRVVPFNGHTEDELLERAAAMEQHSDHPIAQAVIDYVKTQNLSFQAADDVRALGGRGAEGTFDGRRFWIGSHRFMHEQGAETDEIHAAAVGLEDAGHTVAAVGNSEHVCGLISVADEVREGIADTIDDLRAAGVEHIVLLTGDNKQTAQAIAQVAGIDEFHADLLPEDKVAHVERLLTERESVAMVGDGINDAPAMAVSTLGIAMGAIGTDTAIETADVALMTDDLSRIPWLIRHARRTLTIIKQNIAFALTLKAVFVVLTLFGVASLWLAIAADTGASLLVIANGLRLLRADEV